MNPSTETKPEESSRNSNQIPRSQDIRDQPSTSTAAIGSSNQNMDEALLSDDDEDLLAGYTGKLYTFIKFLNTWILV